MRNKLKPCPHCLSENIGVRCRSDVVRYSDGQPMNVRRVRYYVRCRSCKARGPEIHGHCLPANSTLNDFISMPHWMMLADDVKKIAIDRWNERFEPDNAPDATAG